VHRFPFSCVSIGLTIGKRPVVGVVYNPILNELYHAGALLCMLWSIDAAVRKRCGGFTLKQRVQFSTRAVAATLHYVTAPSTALLAVVGGVNAGSSTNIKAHCHRVLLHSLQWWAAALSSTASPSACRRRPSSKRR